MKRVLDWLRMRLTSQRTPDSMPGKVLFMLAATRDKELSCNDVYRMLDQFAEAILRGKPVKGFMASIAQHLEICPDCREEYEALLAMMKAA
ncbi:MAG TPA: hypothetical protein VI703_01925 [Anaerolineales bacterium]|nr:hypothetical protein [Anaerolineales bacterium]